MWKYTGEFRPAFAPNPKMGKESVWDYPRPPRLEFTKALVEVWYGEDLIARSTRCIRLLETASPPQFYIPPEDVRQERLQPGSGQSTCEWKGRAHYWRLKEADQVGNVGWGYADARAPYSLLNGCFAFYAGPLQCYVNGEKVQPQPGEFYGGWITSRITGPFKGAPGTEHW